MMDELMTQDLVKEAYVPEGGTMHTTEAAEQLTASQMHVLAELLAQDIAVFGGTIIPAPATGLIRRVSANGQFREAGIAVDVQIGPAVLCLFAPDWLTSEMSGPRLPDLATLFVQRIREVHRARQRHTDRFAQARRMIDAAIECSSAGMMLVSLKTTSQRLDADLTGCYLQLEATVSMLNDALEPHTQQIVAWTARELANSITLHGRGQRKHLRALARLEASGAVLEIDALAERAITFAGANLAECATALRTSCDPENGLGQAVVLSETADGRTSVYLRSGRIMASIWLVNVGLVSGRSFMIDRVFAEVVTDSLPGRVASTIVDRPLLRDVRIASARRHRGNQTLVQLRMPARFISAAELNETVPLAA